MAKVEIVEVRAIPSTVEGRAGKTDRLVFYRVEGGRVDIVRVPDEGFTNAIAEAAVRKEIQLKGSVVGLKFDV